MCEISSPVFVAVTANNTILVSTNNHILYKVTRQGIPSELTQRKHSLKLNNNLVIGSQNYEVDAIAGSGKAGRADGRPDECRFYCPYGIAVDEASHSCIVTSGNHTIRKISFVNPN